MGAANSIRVLAVTSVVSAACAQIGQRPPVHQDRLIRTNQVEQPTRDLFTDARLDGTRLELVVTRACDQTAVPIVSRTTTVDSYNEQRGGTWFQAGAGLTSIALGIVLVRDAKNTYPDDTTSRTYNTIGPKFERGSGYVAIGTGTLLEAIAIVDAIRASTSETTPEREVELPGVPSKRGVPCREHPTGSLEVTGILQGEAVQLGSTDPTGQLHVDLDGAIADRVVLKRGARLDLIVDGKARGAIELAAVADARAARAFSGLSLEACRRPTDAEACEPLKGFLRDYAEFPQAAPVRAVLLVGEPLISAIEDDEAWAAVKAGDCAKADIVDPDEIVSACESAINYRKVYPDGRHSEEATKLLDQARARVQKSIEAEQRTQSAAAAKEAAVKRKRCQGSCKLDCSHWTVRDFGICLQGCVESRCTEE